MPKFEKKYIPNYLTILRLILVPIIFLLILLEYYWAAFAFFVIANITDVLDGRIARTIKESNNGKQVDKEYQPGNYIPTLSSEHQQDDDRVRIVITPPTGTTTYMTSYIITGLVGTVVILIGTWFIRKDIKKSKKS